MPVNTSLPSDDEIDLRQLMRNIWGTRYTVLLFAAIVISVFSIYLVKKSTSNQETYLQVIGFTFVGVQDARYPNGDQFRPEDIVAPTVINAVYKDLSLADYNITLQQLSSQINVYPYSPSRAFIIEKYTSILADKASSDVVKAEARNSLESELAKALASSASIQFVNVDNLIPQQTAKKIVSLIAKHWADQAISLRGVTKKDLALLSPEVIDTALKNNNSPLQQLTIFWGYFNTFQQQVTALTQESSAVNIIDPESNYSARDLATLMASLERDIVEIPTAWSLETNSNLGLNLPLYSPSLFDASLVDNLDYLVAVDVLNQRIRLVQTNLNQLSEQKFAGIVTDPATQLTLRDLDRLLQDMQEYELPQLRAPLLQLGISKDPARVPLYYNFKINELTRQATGLKQRVAAIQSAESRYVNGGANNGQAASSQQPTSDTAFGRTTTMIPQFGDSFLDKLISMSEKGGDVSYRQDLNKEVIGIERQAIEIEQKIAEIKEFLTLFTQATAKNTISDALRADYTKQINQLFTSSFARLKSYAQSMQRISSRLRFAQEVSNTFASSKVALPEDAYLQNSPNNSNNGALTLSDTSKQMKDYIHIAQRISDAINSDRLGVINQLFIYSDEPKLLTVPLVSKKDLLLLVLGLFLATMFAVLGQLAVNALRPTKAS